MVAPVTYLDPCKSLKLDGCVFIPWLRLSRQWPAGGSTIGIGAHLGELALVGAVRNDGLCGVLARLELRSLRFLRRVGLLLSNFDVLVPGDRLLAFRLLFVCSADLDKLRLGGNLCLYVGVQLRRIAVRVGALCGIWANCKSFLPALRCRAGRNGKFVLDPPLDSRLEL